MTDMKRTTISLSDSLSVALEQYRNSQEVRASLSAIVQAALREYLARRGHGLEPERGTFRITPAARGSGSSDVSANHDRYLAEAVRHE